MQKFRVVAEQMAKKFRGYFFLPHAVVQGERSQYSGGMGR